MNRVKLKLLIWGIPTYRAPVFRRLSHSPNLDFEVCAGDNTKAIDGANVPSAVEVGHNSGINWRMLQSRRLRWPRNYEWQPGAVKMAWKEDFDALIFQGNKSVSNWLVMLICRLRGIPVIDWSIGVMGPEKGLKWAIRKFFLSWSNAHLLYGGFAREFYIQHGFSPDLVGVIHNSLDYDRQVAIRDAITAGQIRGVREKFAVTGADDRLLFHTGRVEPKKNLPLLLSALRILKDRGRRITLVIIGGGREEGPLRRQAKDEDIEDRVIFYGPCYEEEVLGPIISASDLAVVPGVTGLIAMHSLVYGTPILTRDNSAWLHGPEVEAVVEGRTGGFFRDGDVNDLVAKMEAMLYPTSCKERMRAACMKTIDAEYTPRYQERVVIEMLDRLLPEKKRIHMA